jgi:16S rRNA (guanine527-N7)-methyltransferase
VKRLHEVCAALGLDVAAEQKLAALLELLANDPDAPTSVTAPSEAVDIHIADSLSVLSILADRPPPAAIVDIGSGAGFPGLPLAVVFGESQVDLVESTSRKSRFIDRAAALLELDRARAVPVRAEDWARADGAGRYELAVVRAVAPLSTLLEYASPLLREGGLLIAWKGARDFTEEEHATIAAPALGMVLREVHRVTPFPDAHNRHLHVFEKTGSTPAGIPRRAGMAQKRPFGGEGSTPNY